jgi:hypothetical protein
VLEIVVDGLDPRGHQALCAPARGRAACWRIEISRNYGGKLGSTTSISTRLPGLGRDSQFSAAAPAGSLPICSVLSSSTGIRRTSSPSKRSRPASAHCRELAVEGRRSNQCDAVLLRIIPRIARADHLRVDAIASLNVSAFPSSTLPVIEPRWTSL